MMNHFGEIFKTFRESRGLRLKDVAKAGISTSQLSRFEKGETDLTISTFMLILDESNMPIDEFMYAVHDFHRDNTIQDSDGLKQLLHAQLASTDKKEMFTDIFWHIQHV
ncbi:Transcriptional regulator, MutR family [Streptococcus pyogenes MGAS10270]|nr:Transcriptional regulator, MutR family [Streptococcus pyogenes MGAS10270]